MVWAIYFLATHKDVQEKVYKELKDVVGSSSLSYTVLPKLKYLRQVINETLRMAAVEPWTARCQDLDAEIGGHIIPKKTPVIQALGVVLHSENYWSLPKMFNPDRFDEDDTNSRSKLAFQPFGFSGKRKCPGSDLVYVQLALYISVICTKFELHLVDGQVVNPLQRVITRPEDEVWITISPRS
ncbi:cytochrome P450 20A1-like [Tachypleus tridentatus]|uniref:cytochrome P450 20A1-like n=1 Tax=Tachypleus tridentatus TaxID=6853 RepID=UPI003FD00B24